MVYRDVQPIWQKRNEPNACAWGGSQRFCTTPRVSHNKSESLIEMVRGIRILKATFLVFWRHPGRHPGWGCNDCSNAVASCSGAVARL